MPTEVILPKVDMDMTTGTISKWHVADGALVKKGQLVFDIETDKSAMEIESPADGVIKITNSTLGQPIAIGSVVGLVFAAGEKQEIPTAAKSAPVAAPVAPVQVAVAAAPLAFSTVSSGIPRATPLARRKAREAGIELSKLKGSGPYGRVVAADVVQPMKVAAVAEVLAGQVVKPFDGMRRIIAQRLTQSKQTIPHFYLNATCTIDLLLHMRERLNLQLAKQGSVKLSINDFIIKAMGLALQRVPDANVSYVEQGVLQRSGRKIIFKAAAVNFDLAGSMSHADAGDGALTAAGAPDEGLLGLWIGRFGGGFFSHGNIVQLKGSGFAYQANFNGLGC